MNYLREFRQRLASADDSPTAADFYEQARASRLWRIASQTAQKAA
ncbi:MAG TPA: hypothetical protein VE733_20225 [Streptosporangiaceae bacterium]|nr:hypothetical protein [Streptosporangiaceae bacterium]